MFDPGRRWECEIRVPPVMMSFRRNPLGHRVPRSAVGLIIMALVNGAVEAAAQESPGTVYAVGGMAITAQAQLSSPSAPPFAAPGGVTRGWLFGGGVFLTPRLSFEIDTSRTGVMETRAIGRHDTSEASTRRDRFVSITLKSHFRFPVRVEPVAGLVLVGNEGTYESFTSRSDRGFYPLAWNPGVTFGSDFRIGQERVAFVPGVRFMWTGTPVGDSCHVSLSGEPQCISDQPRWEYRYPHWTFRASLAVGVMF